MVDAHLIESSDLKWSGKFDIILEFKHEQEGEKLISFYKLKNTPFLWQ